MLDQKEPRMRKDGTCFVCRKPRTIPKPLQKGVPAWVYERDPFCSATCARRYYGTSLPTAVTAS